MNDTTTVGTFKCPRPMCKDKAPFQSKMALNMHTMRVHTMAGKKGAMWAKLKPGKQTPEAKLKKAREYNKRFRERNLAKGLTSSGSPRKRSGAGPLWKKNKNEYNRRWYLKNKAKKNRILIPYPDPRTGGTDAPEPEPQQQAPMNYCPGCGLHLAQYRE